MPSLQKEGLPYWIFWFMLFIIMLLLLFIFLRDRNLRLRMSSFFAGARRRSLLLQLKFKLKRERQKRESVLKKLGERAWDRDIAVDGADPTLLALEETVKKRDGAQMEGKSVFTEIEKLHKRLEELNAQSDQKIREVRTQKQPFDELYKKKKEEARNLKKLPPEGEAGRQLDEIRREIDETVKRIEEIEGRIRELEAEKRDQQREVAREIHFWEKKKQKLQEQIKGIDSEREDLYLSLGLLLEEKRIQSQELGGLYAEVDLVNERIATLHHRIQSLGG
jgi:chromosome segregation ATPase